MSRVRTRRQDTAPRLIALDLAFANLGWVVFEGGEPIDAGVIVTTKAGKKTGVRVADDHVLRCQTQTAALEDVCRAFKVKGVLAELPSGAQDANAATAFGLCKGVLGAFLQLTELPAEFFTPQEVKKAMAGKASVSKTEMMDLAVEFYGERKETRPHGKKTRDIYHFVNKEYGVGAFEHIADACGVYRAAKLGNLIKMFG